MQHSQHQPNPRSLWDFCSVAQVWQAPGTNHQYPMYHTPCLAQEESTKQAVSLPNFPLHTQNAPGMVHIKQSPSLAVLSPTTYIWPAPGQPTHKGLNVGFKPEFLYELNLGFEAEFLGFKAEFLCTKSYIRSWKHCQKQGLSSQATNKRQLV
jgi:hypothetical protein